MKRIFIILLIPFLFFICYLIYRFTDYKKESYLFIGDGLLKNNSKYGNTCFVNDDYRVDDIINILEYNELNECNKSIHLLLNRSNYLVISIGNNDIMSDIDDNIEIFYLELSNMIKSINSLLNMISRYDFDNVLFLGYYKFDSRHSDYVAYLNNNIKKLLDKYGYEFINLDREISPYMIKNDGNYMLNDIGYFKLNKILVEKYKNT